LVYNSLLITLVLTFGRQGRRPRRDEPPGTSCWRADAPWPRAGVLGGAVAVRGGKAAEGAWNASGGVPPSLKDRV